MLRTKLYVLAIVVGFVVQAQQKPFEIQFTGYQKSADTIVNEQCMYAFYNKLAHLDSINTPETVSIVHIGDSHIQGDFMTRELRNAFQKQFGDAGRGLVFPHRLTKSNESYDYRSHSDNRWQWASIRSRKSTTDPGIAGISLFSSDDMQKLNIAVTQHDSIDKSFDYVQVICRNDSAPNIAFIETNTSERRLIGFANDTLYHIPLKKAATNFTFQTTTPLTVDGFILGKNAKGIQYHVIGVNGAHYADYNKSDAFFSQMHLLQPDLILVSLGTNEGVNAGITAQVVEKEASKMLAKIRAAGVTCPVALLTPFDNYYRRRKPNSNLKKVQQGIRNAALNNNMTCIDMYSITGGYGSASEWRAKGLITSDRIHYSAAGYRLQGQLIFNTLINSYLNYAQH
ncbi:MAG: hypothetical protein KA206_10615 [Paludibacter sp.]|nr:hypothetical protein [Paludibacter sp.]